MIIDNKTGLVLEGGGMRGVFTSGVLDYLLDKKIYFPYGVGVSAGACNGLSYWSRQKGRAKYSNIDLLEKYQYIGMKYLWTQRSILDMKLLFDTFPNEVAPYDFDAYRNNPGKFEMVLTNCRTGHPYYACESEDSALLVEKAKASSSLPYVCPIVWIDDVPYLDGGIVDSIPVLRAQQMGYEKNVVVLTRNKGYRKSEKDIRIPRFIYKNYPRLRAVLSRRCQLYNKQLELVEKLEAEGKVLVIRPEKELQVDRMCRDIKKLTELYEEGYACAGKCLGV